MLQRGVVLFPVWLGSSAAVHNVSSLYWSSAAASSCLSLCQVRNHGLMEAFRGMIGRSIRHSALGTLAALISSLGLLTSQGWMLHQNTDQMTVPCFVGTCKGVGIRQRKNICLVSAAPEAFFPHLFGAFVLLLLPRSNVHRSSFVM